MRAQDDGAACVRQNRVVLAAVAAVKPCGGEIESTGSFAPSIREATVTKKEFVAEESAA